jgi:arsenate reductase
LITIYGIPNCDSCRKARKWLDENSITHEFHDIRVDGLDLKALYRWASQVGWEKLLNTRSQTWRNIAQSDREGIDEGRALALMYEQPTLIKRPVFESANIVLVGFSADEYRKNVSN